MFLAAAGSAAVAVLALFLFVAIVDPWDGLPLSPPLPRQPATASARHAYPMLARDPGYNAAVFGSSTARLLRPTRLDEAFGTRFVNLAFDAATATETLALLRVFLRAHPNADTIVLGLDQAWCRPETEASHASRPFPDWLYADNRWADNRWADNRWQGYAALLNPYAVQEAWAQAATMLGLRAPRHRRDGYNDFGVDEARYDVARALANIRAAGIAPAPETPGALADPVFAPLPALANTLMGIPHATRVVLFFVPFALAHQGPAGSASQAYWAACKRQVAQMAAGRSNIHVLDFMIDSPITRDPANYYDAIHYRPHVVDRLVESLARAVRDATRDADEISVRLRSHLPAERERVDRESDRGRR